MSKVVFSAVLFACSTLAHAESNTLINGLDFGPLAQLAGTWESTDTGGVDVAPGQDGSKVGKGGPAVEPFYEVITFEPAADAKNASDQYLVAMYYKQEVFKKSDNSKFHDQRGYLIYDKKNQLVYNSYCIPRAVCVVTEGKAGNKIEFKTGKRGIAESAYMTTNDSTTDFSMTLDFSQKNLLKYNQTTSLMVYEKPFAHSDSASLTKVK
ncbi:TPA: FABP family protein [Aeromonas veronii]|nr:FABP family protein [Aeromonas veronii]